MTSGPGDVLDRMPPAVRGRVADSPFPAWRDPMLATLTDERFSREDWVFERKLDGIRCLAYADGGAVRLRSRNRQDLSGAYPEIVDALQAQRAGSVVLDGEVVAFEGRRTSFARLQGRSGLSDPARARASGIPVFYYVFDILQIDDLDVRGAPLTWRKRLLRASITFEGPLRYTTHRVGAGEEAYRTACRRGDEGVIAKRADAPYASGRSRDWLKFKCVKDQELVIAGFTEPRGQRVGLGALLVGYYDGDRLVYAGKVGTGFSEKVLRDLHARLTDLERDKPSFAQGKPADKDVRWVEPRLVAEIGFTEWTRDGRLRHPRYLGLRQDKRARDVVRESR